MTIYVLFEGYVPGIYKSWPLCKLQVYRYSGNVYKGFSTYKEALRAWTEYCEVMGYDEEHIKRGIPKKTSTNRQEVHQDTVYDMQSYYSSSNGESSTQIQSEGVEDVGINEFSSSFAEDASSMDWISQKSLQKEVDRICYKLRIPLPTYELDQVNVFGGIEYFKYCGVLQGRGASSRLVGRFGRTTYDAKEDVAMILIRHLLEYCGKKIRDYNHYNLEIMEKRVNMLELKNLELSMELEMVKDELAASKRKGKEVKN